MHKLKRRPIRKRNENNELQCNKCKDWKGEDEFYDAKSTRRLVTQKFSACKVCVRKYKKAYDKRKSEQIKEKEILSPVPSNNSVMMLRMKLV